MTETVYKKSERFPTLPVGYRWEVSRPSLVETWRIRLLTEGFVLVDSALIAVDFYGWSGVVERMEHMKRVNFSNPMSLEMQRRLGLA